jgi:uncharacterized membrane protein YqjE
MLTFMWGVLGLLVLVVWAISIYDIFRRHLGGKKTTAWLLIVIILPLVGSILYWALRKEDSPEDVEATAVAEAARREELRRRPVDSGYGG